jgi:hypothetical protein
MSNEIISISSSDGDDSTIVGVDDTTVIELLSPLPVKSEAADDQRVTSVPDVKIPVSQILLAVHTNYVYVRTYVRYIATATYAVTREIPHVCCRPPTYNYLHRV